MWRDGQLQSPNVVFPARIVMTESGAVSATQVMATGGSRWLVGAAAPSHHLDAPRPVGLTRERGQKAEQYLETRGKPKGPASSVELDVAHRFTETSELLQC